jgi:hypothetical protein
VWKYDSGDNRCKHRWHKDEAGHLMEGRRLVGKCPKSLDPVKAEDALNSGYPYFDERDGEHTFPSRIFAVIDGVVYRAMPTMPGVSYHGFPELARSLPPDDTLKAAILDLAVADGSRKEVEKWLKSRT